MLPSPGTGDEVFAIHRLKARLPISNGDVKIVQGVRDVFEIVDAPSVSESTSETASTRQGKVVLIGRHLVDLPFRESLIKTIGSI
jgi:hypothetical protein